MFEKKHILRTLGLGVLATSVLACQGQQQQQQQQQPQQAGKPIEFSSAGFEGIEIGKLALLANDCDPATDPVVITVGANEFAYLYLRPADSSVVANANSTGGGECAFPSTSKISIVSAGSGTQNRKVLLDFLNGQFAKGGDGTTGLDALGITIDLGSDAGTHQVMFRGTVDADLFTFGSTTSPAKNYGAYASSSTGVPTATAHADFSFAGVSDILVSTGPSNDIITGQGSSVAPIMGALDGDISLTVFGGEGDDKITSGSAGAGINSLNGNAGADIFYQVPGVYAHDVISGGVDPLATVTLTDVTTGTGTGTDTITNTGTGTGTTTQTNTGTTTGTTTTTTTGTTTGTMTNTSNKTATGTQTGTGTSTKTHTATSTTTVTNTGTGTGTTTLTNTGTGTSTATLTNTGTGTTTKTITTTSTSTSTGTAGDVSVDVVDYSNYTVPVKVTLGDQDLAVAASATIICVDSNMINDYDGFTINDGTTTKVVEYHGRLDRATGTITSPADDPTLGLASNDTFTVDDGVKPVTFEIIEATDTKTATSTNTNAVITLTGALDANGVASAIAAGIVNYQTITYTGTATGTATMTDTSISPNVTVTPPIAASAVIGLQNRSSTSPATFLAASSLTLTAAVLADAPLQKANPTAIVVLVDHADGDDLAKVGPDTVTALASGGLAIVTTRAGIVLTVASSATGSKPSFAVTKTSGGFAISNISTGSAKLGGNDGYAAGNEKDSILADVEMVIGTPKDDVIDATHAYTNRHIFLGMDGNDTLSMGPSLSPITNILYGGKGNDHLLGGSYVDYLYGGDGNDWLAGGLGDDIIDGDGVNCDIAAAYVSSLCTSGSAAASGVLGVNVLDYSDRTNPVTVDLRNLATPGSQFGETGEKDSVVACMHVRGGAGADTLTGDSGDNMIWGGPGDDTILGGGGNDTLYGDMGNDTVAGEAGNDFIFGGAGINKLYGDSATDPTIVGNNMLDNSEGTKGTVDCGSGNMDILFSNGAETSIISCEMM